MIAPFIWMLSTSLKSLNEVFVFPPTLFGESLRWNNYLQISDRFPFSIFFLNSMKIAVLVTAGQLFTCSLGGYSFARLKFPGRDIIFLLYLATLMIPYFVIVIPIFIMMRSFGWVDTHYALIVPGLFSAFGTFLMKQFFLTIPRELEDAAKIDGCTPFGIYRRIFLPLSKPALAALGIFTFMWSWNDFLAPLIFLNTITKRTIPLGLAVMQGLYSTDWPSLMAASVLSVMPIIIVFLCAQEFFVKGITLSGLKA
ncbi:sugar ABC transporter permease [Candidatus Aerophobetes bacterium Ae_b3a]|nr:MAG: sugar ABC transporter permease [Candidatus Aerophobetes bacterium Ae_b3a]